MSSFQDCYKSAESNFEKLNDLLTKYLIQVKTDSEFAPGLAILKHKRDASTEYPIVKQTKGLVINTGTLKIVAPSVCIPEDTSAEFREETLTKLRDVGIKSCYKAVDGVLIRVYFHGDELMFSTNSMIYPNKGWNGSRTFADMFPDVLNELNYEGFQQGYCYYIMMEHPDHCNVITHSKPHGVLLQVTKVDEFDPMPTPEEDLSDFHSKLVEGQTKGDVLTLPEAGPTTVDKLLEELSAEQSLPVQSVGFYVVDTEGNHYRFETESFEEAKRLLGNEPDPRKHWAKLITSGEEQRELYLKYFPNNEKSLSKMDYMFNGLVKKLYSEYGRRFKLGQYVVHHSRHVKTMNQIHQVYLDRRKSGNDNKDARITEHFIRQFLLEKDPREIYYIVNPDKIESSTDRDRR